MECQLFKSQLNALQTVIYHGFIADSYRMCYFTREEKQTKYLNSLNFMLQKHHSEGQVPAKMAANVFGKIQSEKIPWKCS